MKYVVEDSHDIIELSVLILPGDADHELDELVNRDCVLGIARQLGGGRFLTCDNTKMRCDHL